MPSLVASARIETVTYQVDGMKGGPGDKGTQGEGEKESGNEEAGSRVKEPS
jgi:hypothetical protein